MFPKTKSEWITKRAQINLFLIVVVVIPAMFLDLPPIVVYFSIHHALNETYTLNKFYNLKYREIATLNVLRTLLAFACCGLVLHRISWFKYLSYETWFILALLLMVSVLVTMFKQSDNIEPVVKRELAEFMRMLKAGEIKNVRENPNTLNTSP